ncbi:MAG TPA: N-(5'-phosphoribosyl)anthranilate isomerase [Solibacterales bacterium]|nr:N-(5'-phosphoribosyl)anthranilate isomerase [Bryobacterales bacterium]
MIVKICGITSPCDALAAVRAGAAALGFNFYPASPRFVSVEAAQRIAAVLPPGVLKVGVFVNETLERAAEVVAAAGLNVAQMHGAEVPEMAAPHPGVRVWLALPAAPGLAARIASARAEAFLVDTPSPSHGGTGRAFDWSLAEALPGRIVLAGGLGPDNVAEAIRRVRPWGVDAASRLERAPGVKDHEKMRQFVEAALREARTLC